MADRLHVRRATAADHETVRALLADDISKHRRCFGDFDVEWLLQTSAMGIVAEADGGADGSPICGFASFVDAPLDPDSRELSDKAFLDWYRPHIEAAGASDADEARVSNGLAESCFRVNGPVSQNVQPSASSRSRKWIKTPAFRLSFRYPPMLRSLGVCCGLQLAPPTTLWHRSVSSSRR